MFGIMPIGLSFFEFQFQTDESYREWMIFLNKSNYIAGENIIDLTVALSEIFNRNMTKEEAEKLLFVKSEMPKENIENYGLPPCQYLASEEFRNIIYKSKNKYIYGIFNGVRDIGWAIADYFDGKENNNNENEEKNKNFNKENKINNVVENTAKEKIMSNNDELTLNLLILGQTGVGKSSLINALFGEIVAKAGPGKPISTHIKKYETELDGKKVNLYDSMGFEVNNEKCIKDIKDALKERSADKDIKDWFHSVTYCIQAGGLKIQDFDIKMIKQFVDENYNVIIALTKSDQIGKAKREEFIEIIKKEVKEETKKDIMVITVSADPEQLDHMTEKPKPSGLEEYKAAILISWREIFINRIPLNIIEKLKKDIENAKYNAPNRKPKDDDDLKILAKEIQEYFNNVLKENLQSRIKENFEKYYKINEDIININTNIDISNFYSRKNIDPYTYLYDYIGFSISHLFEHIKDLFKYLYSRMKIKENIEEFINKTYKETKEYISKKEFEDNIRKSIIDIFNKIENKKN